MCLGSVLEMDVRGKIMKLEIEIERFQRQIDAVETPEERKTALISLVTAKENRVIALEKMLLTSDTCLDEDELKPLQPQDDITTQTLLLSENVSSKSETSRNDVQGGTNALDESSVFVIKYIAEV